MIWSNFGDAATMRLVQNPGQVTCRSQTIVTGWPSHTVIVLKRGPSGSAPSIMRDSHGLLCRNRVSLELSSGCILNGKGQIICEAKIASEPEALATFFAGLGLLPAMLAPSSLPATLRYQESRVAA